MKQQTTSSWQSNYNRFQQLFRIGEQIVVGFRDDFTHGYITKIDETGFGLFQLNKPKEYWYDWNHFEFASHPGFRFKKLPNVGEQWIDNVNVFTIKLMDEFTDFPTEHMTERELAMHYQFHNSKDIIACINKFNVLPEDFQSFEPGSPWGKLELRVHTNEAELEAYQKFVQTLPTAKGDFDIIKAYFFDDEEIRFDNLSGTASKYVRDNEELDVMRITQIHPLPRRYVSSGDPWYTDEAVEVVGFNMWKSKDGYAMSNAMAIILEVKE